jgi:hypothetical protein
MTWYRTTRGYGLALTAIRSRNHCSHDCRSTACQEGSIACAFERAGRTYQGYICPELL